MHLIFRLLLLLLHAHLADRMQERTHTTAASSMQPAAAARHEDLGAEIGSLS